MIDLGVYRRLGRTYNQLMLEALEECNTKITDGYIKITNRNDFVEIRYYKNIGDAPAKPVGTYFELKNGIVLG